MINSNSVGSVKCIEASWFVFEGRMYEVYKGRYYRCKSVRRHKVWDVPFAYLAGFPKDVGFLAKRFIAEDQK